MLGVRVVAGSNPATPTIDDPSPYRRVRPLLTSGLDSRHRPNV